MNPMRSDIPPLPVLMTNLPIDKRGYPVPWFVEWVDGEPEFRATSAAKMMRAIQERRCWTCGNPLYREEIFVIGPMCAVNRISSEPPSHRECARYAATACPFLSKPQMVRRANDLPEGVTAPAGVFIERNPGVTLLWFAHRHRLLRERNGVLFRLGRAFKVEWYARGREATRAEIEASIQSGLPTLRAAAEKYNGPEGIALLENQIVEAYRLLPRAV